uniref:Uncharacterized protein n=1 Tax=Glossina brevipalpis TaxID=37001 RepID=A0A1A9WU38_9MUSC
MPKRRPGEKDKPEKQKTNDRPIKKAKYHNSTNEDENQIELNDCIKETAAFNEKSAGDKINSTSNQITNNLRSVITSANATSNKEYNGRRELAENSSEYNEKLRNLNRDLIAKVKIRLDENPLYKLSEIFKEYNRTLEDTRKEEVQKTNTAKELNTDYSTSRFTTVASNCNFDDERPSTSKAAINFSLCKTLAQIGTSAMALSPAKFKFLIAKLFSGSEDDKAEKVQLPILEFKRVVEENAVYSRPCIINEKYEKKGVGVLYLKQVKKKTQLIVRADNNLGTILANLFLSQVLFTSRKVKKMDESNYYLYGYQHFETQAYSKENPRRHSDGIENNFGFLLNIDNCYKHYSK